MNNTTVFDWYPKALVSCEILKLFGVWLLTVMIIGMILNGFVLYLFIKNKDLQSPTNGFLMSITIADFLACLVQVPMPLIANFVCYWPFGKLGCYFEGFFTYFVGSSSMFLLCLVSIDRYIAISMPLEHYRITKTVQILLSLLCCLFGLFCSILPVLGWNSYSFEGALTSCSLKWQDKSISVALYNLFMFLFVFFIPLSIMIFCNISLVKTIKHIATNAYWKLSDRRMKKKLIIEKRLTKQAFLMVFGFIVTWTPYAVAAFISAFWDPNLIKPIYATIPALIAKTQVLWNPLIYVLTNKNFRAKLNLDTNVHDTELLTKDNLNLRIFQG